MNEMFWLGFGVAVVTYLPIVVPCLWLWRADRKRARACMLEMKRLWAERDEARGVALNEAEKRCLSQYKSSTN